MNEGFFMKKMYVVKDISYFVNGFIQSYLRLLFALWSDTCKQQYVHNIYDVYISRMHMDKIRRIRVENAYISSFFHN